MGFGNTSVSKKIRQFWCDTAEVGDGLVTGYLVLD